MVRQTHNKLIRPSLLAITLFAGCGYRLGNLHSYERVRLRILDTRSERRTHEFELTHAIARELSGAGIRVNAPDFTHEILGEIIDIEHPSVVVDTQDVPIVGAVVIKLRIRIVDRTSGRTVLDEEHVERAGFSSSRAESPDSARREVFDRLARWVTTRLESDW